MNTASQLLFRGFPRTVASATEGEIRQHFVHSESEFDLWFKKLRPERSLYSSICRFRSDMRPKLGSIPFDLDSPMKDSVFEEGTSDAEKIEQMRLDEDLTNEVLGDVWNDAQSLMAKCLEEDIPAIGVFSGLGVHVHLLYQEEVEPTEQKVSISQWLIEECDLLTHDVSIITDTRRILRVPNSQRVSQDQPAGVWCIPMTEEEVTSNTVHDLLKRSTAPRELPMKDRYRPENRPQMETKEGYEEVEQDTAGTVPVHNSNTTQLDEIEEQTVKDCIPLPCVRKRFFSSNPHHLIRFTGAILLYEAGFTPKEVRTIIRDIGWVDYDEGITNKMTEQIWNKRYSELPCSRLQSLGLCVQSPEFDDYGDEPSDCETYKWKSGEAFYG